MKPCAALAAATLLAASPLLQAEPAFAVRNEASLSRDTALPTLGDSRILATGARAWSTRLDWSNEYVSKQTARETLLIDGESERLRLGFRQGLAPGVEVGIELPLLFTGGGVLDGAIDGWHDAFGLPNGGRQLRAQDRYAVQYVKDGQTLIDLDHGSEGLGDIELSAGFALREDFAFRALAKLPTGRSRRLLGGNAGGALWFDYSPLAAASRWFGHVSGGVSYNEQGHFLGAQQQQLVGLGGVGLGYRLLPALSLISQFNVQTPLHKGSTLKALDGPGGQLAFGGRIAVNPRLALDLGVQEDILLNSSPDFSIHLGLGWR